MKTRLTFEAAASAAALTSIGDALPGPARIWRMRAAAPARGLWSHAGLKARVQPRLAAASAARH